MNIETLSENGIAGVAIGALVMMVIIIREFLKYLNKAEDRHKEAYDKIAQSIDTNTEATNVGIKVAEETQTYLKLRNGSLEKTLNQFERRKD